MPLFQAKTWLEKFSKRLLITHFYNFRHHILSLSFSLNYIRNLTFLQELYQQIT